MGENGSGKTTLAKVLARLYRPSSGADTVISGLARGYDTLLAREFKDGAELSGGQWQRSQRSRVWRRTLTVKAFSASSSLAGVRTFPVKPSIPGRSRAADHSTAAAAPAS